MTPQTRALIETLEKAEQLASIASDWNLDEVEIDGVMTRTVELEKYFRAAISSAKAAEEGIEGKTFNTEQVFSCAEIDEFCCEWGSPEYVMTDDGEAWYWRFSGHDLPVADNLSELFMAAQHLAKEQYSTGEQVLNEL